MDTLTFPDILKNLSLTLPEVALCATILAVILLDLFLKREQSYKTGILALVGLLVVTYFIFNGFSLDARSAFMGMLKLDAFGSFFKLLFVTATFLVIVYSFYARELERYRTGEYYALLLTATLGMFFLSCSKDFLMFYLSIETVSLSSYLLTGYTKRSSLSNEAAVKYLIYGATASGVMLFGISYIYGMTGTLNIEQVLNVVAFNSISLFAALLLLMVGLWFKVAAVPFHFWCPDVYQGAPTPITAYLSVASKTAGFAAIFRILTPYFNVSELSTSIAGVMRGIDMGNVFYVISIATMTFGNLVALRQTNIKRLLAYSSIAHAGYVLMGFAVFSQTAMEAMLFYLAVYLMMNLGAFLIVITLENKLGSAELDSYSGVMKKMPFLFVSLTVILFSLTGLPPTAGFIAKLNLLYMLVETGSWHFYALALVAVANTVVSLYYYMNIVRIMAFQRPREDIPAPAWSVIDTLLILIMVAPILIFGVYFSPIAKLVQISLL